MTPCKHCGGTGKLPIYTSYSSLRGPSIYSHREPCPFCDATGVERDALRREHEDGDADGLGGCHGLVSVAVMIALICVIVWLLTALRAPSILS